MTFLSIIVCTYNREMLLKNCLEELFKQIPHYADSTEVIVVDNNCTDDTALMVRKYCESYPWLKYVLERKQGLSNARNCGAKIAQGTYLCYLDDDGKPSEKYLSWVHHVLNEYTPDIAGGPIYPYYTTPKPGWFQDEFEIRKFSSTSGFKEKGKIKGGNFIIRAALLSELGMFSPKLGMIGNKTRLGEEAAIMFNYRATRPIESQRVYYSQEAFIYHHVPPYKMKVSYFIKRGFFSGRAIVVLKKNAWGSTRLSLKKIAENLFFQLPLSFVRKAKGNQHAVIVTQMIALDIGKLSMVFQTLFSRRVKQLIERK